MFTFLHIAFRLYSLMAAGLPLHIAYIVYGITYCPSSLFLTVPIRHILSIKCQDHVSNEDNNVIYKSNVPSIESTFLQLQLGLAGHVAEPERQKISVSWSSMWGTDIIRWYIKPVCTYNVIVLLFHTEYSVYYSWQQAVLDKPFRWTELLYPR